MEPLFVWLSTFADSLLNSFAKRIRVALARNASHKLYDRTDFV